MIKDVDYLWWLLEAFQAFNANIMTDRVHMSY